MNSKIINQKEISLKNQSYDSDSNIETKLSYLPEIKECTESTATPKPKKIMTPETSGSKNPMLYYNGGDQEKKGINHINECMAYNTEDLQAEDPNLIGNSGSKDKRKELLIMTIDIGNGQQDTIYVYEEDEPYNLAKEFCEKHKLDENIILPLSQNIYNNMEYVLKERAEALDQQSFNVSKTTKNDAGNDDTLDIPYPDEPKNIPYTELENSKKSRNILGVIEGESGQQSAETRESYSPDQNKTKIQSSNFSKHNNNNEYENYNKTLGNTTEYSNSNNAIKIRDDDDDDNRLSGKNKTISKRNKSLDNNKTLYTGPPLVILPNNHNNISNSAGKSKLSFSKTKNSNWNTNDKENDYVDNLINQSMNMRRNKQQHHNNQLTFTPTINPTSQLIIGYKYQNSRIPVYERLHNQSKINRNKLNNTNKSNISKKSKRSKSKNVLNSTTDLNYGAILYNKTIKRREERNKEILDIKRHEIALEERECTFKPMLNPISTEIINGKQRDEPLEELLIRYGKIAKEKVERARNMKQIEEIETCSFKPIINPISEKIVIEKSEEYEGKERFNKLYDDYKIKIDRQREIAKIVQAEECTFTPAIKNYDSYSSCQMSFEERNRRFVEKLERVAQKRKEREENELKDLNTGKPLFQPSICRAPKTQSRNQEGLPIGEYLYKNRLDIENRKKDLFERDQKSSEAARAKSNEKSNLIIETIKKKKFTDIFKVLDSDNDGVISSTKIDITTLDTNILEMFAPLLCEMEELNQDLNLEEFIEASERLFKSLSIEERNKFLLDKKSHNDNWEKNLVFRPQINKKSIKLANSIRPYGNDTLYDVYINERKEFFERLSQESNKKKLDELKECSFKPNLISSTTSPVVIPINTAQYNSTGIF